MINEVYSEQQPDTTRPHRITLYLKPRICIKVLIIQMAPDTLKGMQTPGIEQLKSVASLQT
jgi:hypothetical protein